jgi:hypothetical protein
MHPPESDVEHLYGNAKGWRTFSLQNCFLPASSSRFVVAKRDGLDPAN